MKKVFAVIFALVLLISMVSIVAAEPSPEQGGADEVEYKMDNVSYTKGTLADTLAVAQIPFTKFANIVLVDGVEVDPANYDAVEGSTRITFRGSYLETLEVGKHTLEVKAKDGKAVSTLEVLAAADGGKTPTGVNTHTAIWVAVSLVSLGCIGLVAFGIKKKAATK